MEPRPCHVRGWWYETAQTDPDPMPSFAEMHRAFEAQDGRAAAAQFVACAMRTTAEASEQAPEKQAKDEEEDEDEEDEDEDEDDE